MASGSIREIGDEQAQEGTSIDGNRLSLMLRQLADRWNNIRSRNIKRRWVPITYQGGFTPQELVDGAQDSLPWLGAYNSDKQRVGSEPTDGYHSPYRSKGNIVSGIDPSDPNTASLDDLLTWSTSFYFLNPARLTGVHVSFVVDTNYGNDFKYGATAPPGKSQYGYVDDWTISIEVDDPFNPEDRALSSIIYKRQQNVASAWQFSNLQAAPGADMQPAHPGGDLAGASSHDSIFVVDQNIDIPIPKQSRVRLHITIPKYETTGTRNDYYQSGWNGNGANPECWQQQAYNWTLHFKEALLP